MPDLAQIQQEFMSLLQTNDRHIEHSVIQQGMLTNAQRLDIYRTGYRIRLRGVIDSDHEMLGLYLGDDLYDQLIDGYIDARPSNHPSLRFFADRLPDYLKQTAPFSAHPILAEMAGFERELLNAFDSADAAPLTEEVLQTIPGESWPQLRFEFHPSLTFYKCQWNAIESWQALKNAGSPPAAQYSEQDKLWAIWRDPIKLTQYKPIQKIERQTLKAMQQGMTFSEVCESLIEHIDEEQIPMTLFSYITAWIKGGWIIKASWGSNS